MPVNRLKQFLDSNDVKYVTIQHSPAYTAMEVAEESHIKGRIMAKTVIFKADDELVMCVVPAGYWVDCHNLKATTGANYVELARESVFAAHFPDCEVGAMPPFGNLVGMKNYMDEKLLENESIAFNAGTHSLVFHMDLGNYIEMANPVIAKISTMEKNKAA